MDRLTLDLNWNIPPKNGLNQFISPELYSKYSVTYRLTNEYVYNYYAKLLNKSEGNKPDDSSNEKEDAEAQNSESKAPRNKRKGKLKANWFGGRTSSLSIREHKKYLVLLQRYSTKVVSVDTPEEEKKAIEALMCLHKKVVREQKKFTEFQKVNAKSGVVYKFIHPEAARYVKELIQKKLQSCLSYPRHYVIKQKFNLSEEVKIDSNILPNLVCNLLELGKVPRLVLTGLENCSIPCNFLKMCSRFPISSETTEQHPSKQTISQDSVAKTLADKHSADMVLTFSSLKHLLMCGSLDSDKSWELPVTVASFQSSEGTDCSKKRVFIDKAIPVGTWSAPRKNALYHKYGAKLLFTHLRMSKCSRKSVLSNQGNSENQQSRKLVDLQDDFFETENFDHETFGQIKYSGDKILSNVSMENGVKASNSKSIDIGSVEVEDEKKKDNHPENVKVDNDNSDHLDNENESGVEKEADDKIGGNADNAIENLSFNEAPSSAETYQPHKDALCKNLQLMNKHDVSENKNSIPNVDDQKVSDGNTSEESPKSKKRKTKNEPLPVLPGRRLTRSQTKKLEDAVKHPEQSKKLAAKMETAKQQQNVDSKYETAARSSSQHKKGSDEQCDKNTQVTEDAKTVKKEVPTNINMKEEISSHGSEYSSDSFPRPPLKKVRLLSSDDDSDDNLVIDETVIGEDKQKLLDKAPNSTELDTANLTCDSKVANVDAVNSQSQEVNAQNVSNKDRTTQCKKIQPLTDDETVNGNKILPDNMKNAGSPLDQILHLQEEMLKPKYKSHKTELLSPTEQKVQGSYGPELSSPTEQKTQEPYGLQPGLPTYLEDTSRFAPLDPSLNTNVQYSLWNMGQLKVIMRSKLDSRQLNSMPCFIFSKLEYQSKFGAEVYTTQELLHQWITLVCHPGSTGLRVRIDARTAKVLMTEELTLPNIHNVVAKFSPEKPLCWAVHFLEKLKELPSGQYLLVYHKKDDAVTLYVATDGNKRGDYDLHTAIRQRLVTLDDKTDWEEDSSETEIPWLPIDPDIMLPSLISRSRIPATFPPANEYKAASKQKKKAKKKKAKTRKKAKLQKS